MRDIRMAIRALRCWPLGASAAILTLAVAIATTTGTYSFLRLTLDDLVGVPAVARVARIYESSDSLHRGRTPVALADVDSTLANVRSIEAMGAYVQADGTAGSAGDAHPVTIGLASPGFFAAMGVPAAAGRLFTSADAGPRQPVAILSDRLWRRRFPGRTLTGASILVDGVERSVVGVMPRSFSFGLIGVTADLWVPLGQASSEAPHVVSVFARLRRGVQWPTAAAELGTLRRDHGRTGWRAIPIQEDQQYRAAGQSLLTLGPALVILLIGCVNVSCMLMARGIERAKELSVRRALGATRVRIVRQLVLETALLAVPGGVLGVGLSAAILRLLASGLAAVRPEVADRLSAQFDLLPAAMTVTVASCVLAGTVPALRLSRGDVAAVLKGVPSTRRIGAAAYGARDIIVFVETGVAAALLLFAAMLFNLFGEMRRVTALFPATQVVGLQVPVRDVDEVERRVGALPGVTGVAVTAALPGSAVAWRGAAEARGDDGHTVAVTRIPARASLFTTLGVSMVRGRSFDATEDGAPSDVTVLSEGAARRLAPDSDPLGTHVRIAGRSMVVIGICRDAIAYGGLGVAGFVPPDVYVPYEPPANGDAFVLARVPVAAQGVLGAMAAESRTPSHPDPRPWSMAERMQLVGATDEGALVSQLLGAFAAVALLLAASGLFGVISQSVAQRTTEFGIRMAMGATPRGVLGMVLARESKLIAVALVTGTSVTFTVARSTFVELARLTAASPSVWWMTVLLCGSVATVTCLVATRRIVTLEPWVVLRRS